MKTSILFTMSALAIAAPVAHSAEPMDDPNRFYLGARFGFNLSADFRNNGVGLSGSNPGLPVGGANHTYDDGYVRLDSSADAGGLTWNWGYRNGSQVVGDNLEFHAAQFNGGTSQKNKTDDPQYGAEVIYRRLIGPFLGGHWGMEAAFSFTDVNLNNRSGGAGVFITDSFPLNGVLPPRAGYSGAFAGPGPLLGDTPVRTLQNASITSRERLNVQMFGIRFGPFAEWSLFEQCYFSFSGGLAVVPFTAEYRVSQTTVLAGGAAGGARDRSSKSDLLYGPYAAAMLRYDIGERMAIYIGAQFQNLNDLKQSVAGYSVKLDQSATVFGLAGVGVKF